MKLLVIDNYDSFTYNLVHLIEKISTISFDVVLNDKITLQDVNSYSKIILSPGPGLPKNAGIMPELLHHYHKTKSIFGVCLGLQAIGETFGAKLSNLNQVCHGMATPINTINDDKLFKNCPNTFNVGRYHSWVIAPDNLPENIIVTAVDNSNNIMAIRHKTFDVCGVQFHPESILSEYGETIISNWIEG